MSNTAAKRVAPPQPEDSDSPMQDTGSAAPSPTTPPGQTSSTNFNNSELSPPDSQQLQVQNPNNAPSPFTPLATGKSAANTSKKMPPSEKLNANGKRNWDLESNGADKVGKDASASASTGSSGPYTWERDEDAPGYAWMNAKAREEANRAWTQVVDKDRKIGKKYGDVLLE